MLEFKISNSIVFEAAALKAAGQALNSDYAELSSGDLSTLVTSVKYINQHRQLKELIESYVALIEKDAEDLRKMQSSSKNIDDYIAGSFSR